MKFLRLHSIAAGLVLLVAAFGVLSTGAGASDKHAIEVTVTRGESGKPVHNAHIFVQTQNPKMTIDENWSDRSGMHTFMVPDITGKYCIWAVSAEQGGTSYQHCFENEYPETVDLVLH